MEAGRAALGFGLLSGDRSRGEDRGLGWGMAACDRDRWGLGRVQKWEADF